MTQSLARTPNPGYIDVHKVFGGRLPIYNRDSLIHLTNAGPSAFTPICTEKA